MKPIFIEVRTLHATVYVNISNIRTIVPAREYCNIFMVAETEALKTRESYNDVKARVDAALA